MATAAVQPPRPFSLRRRFAITSLAVILLIALGLGAPVSHLLTERMLRREAEVSMDFIRHLLVTDDSLGFFEHPEDPELRRRFLRAMGQLAQTEPIRANAFDRSGRVLWSTQAELIGRRDQDNDELREALAGELAVESGALRGFSRDKQEHAGLSDSTHYYVESYIPVRAAGSGAVVGVIELYRVPVQLSASIREGLLQLWLACAASGVALFLGLNGIVRRADRVMREQQARIAESQALASAVELAGAVAHNLRNPGIDPHHGGDAGGGCARRRGVGVQGRHHRLGGPRQPLDHRAGPRLQRRPVAAGERRHHAALARLPGGSAARDAAPGRHPGAAGGRGAAGARQRRHAAADPAERSGERDRSHAAGRTGAHRPEARDGCLHTTLDDAGSGIGEEARHALFRPFFSTKSGGTGIGPALARKTLADWDGSIDLRSREGIGSRLSIALPLASKEA
ncbi:hypothetical protein HK414_26900 [Ramlibacter terrae]|uniref:histidine kinase n=1 Tax=Ramlibacter terrae TaxID=2732511 RepID=A0ABX6P9H1_9BURK|nr:hypothetical protein HK414_26900 [Ramlibacter terrae]